MLIAGIDEAGRGPLAGPVVAAAVVFEEGYSNSEIRDSKQLSASKREKLVDVITSESRDYAVVAVGPRRIEQLNIRQATREAMRLALRRVVCPDLVLIDGNTPIETTLAQETVVKGDQKHVEIAAASILAKVWRDSLMVRIGRRYPGYEFEEHVGYPTKAHRALVKELGPCRVHRETFSGVREYLFKKAPGSSCTNNESSLETRNPILPLFPLRKPPEVRALR